MSTWEELKAVVDDLRNDPGQPLRGFVGVAGERSPLAPSRLSLAAWAVEIAESLDARFGPQLSITVGALRFPDRTFPDPTLVVRDPRWPRHLPRLDPDLVEVSLSGELEVRSGHDERREVQVRNRGRHQLAIRTNGQLTARIIDPASGEVVGGFTGFQAAPLVVFRAEPGRTVLVPLLIGTASFAPELGYAIPPGGWLTEAILDLGDGDRRVTPPLPITVVA